MMVWSDMLDMNLDATGERLNAAAAAKEEADEAEEVTETGRVKLEMKRRGARRATDMDVPVFW